jgi:hypothetical protein
MVETQILQNLDNHQDVIVFLRITRGVKPGVSQVCPVEAPKDGLTGWLLPDLMPWMRRIAVKVARVRNLFILVILAGACAILVSMLGGLGNLGQGVRSLLAEGSLSAQYEINSIEEVKQALEQARLAGSYSFTADVAQTLLPRSAPETIGQSNKRIDWRVEGEVRLPDYSLTQLQVEGDLGQTPPVTIVQDGSKSYLQVGDERKPLDSSSGMVGGAATQDFLGYLNAATNVLPLEPEWAGGEQFSRYAFDIDPQKFAEYAREVMTRQLQGQTPVGAHVTVPGYLLTMTGTGELWVDSAGLPRRQVLDVDMPAASEFYNARLHIIVDFRDFGAVTSVLSSVIPPRSPIILQPSSLILYFVCLALAALILAYRRRSRQIYAAISILLIVSFTLSPLLETMSLARFQERQAQAATANPIANAFGFNTTADPKLATDNQQQTAAVGNPLPAGTRHQSSVLDEPLSTCGSGSPGVDADSDGLNDQAEYCLGTDPYYADSDRDLITDTLELTGFDFAGKHWTADPFKVDSNDDGAPDFVEWPAPVGEAPEWDPDDDKIPNLWDDDNDGDLVPDNLDLSPYARSTYTNAFTLDSQVGGFNGYRYIEVQLQPQNLDSLRYSTSYLDWPYDNQGQLQDLDNSIEDIHLKPMLKVRTDQVPERTLAQKYGIVSFTEDRHTFLYAPLLPVSDAGQYVAFYTKIPYGPVAPDIHWEKASLVWVVQMSMDEAVASQTVTKTGPIQVYANEPFRLTGLEILMSKDYQSAILGTPAMPVDDSQLFNLVFGLSATFLNNQTPDLQTIYNRFTGSNTPLVEKWGVTTPVAIDLPPAYGHLDEGLADMSVRLPAFLERYSHEVTPTLLIANQEQIGHFNLSDQGVFEPDNHFEANLADIPMSQQRGLKLATYAYRDGQWQNLTLDETLEVISVRYEDMSTILGDLQAQYPDLTENDLEATLYMFYSVWFTGQNRMLSLGGWDLAPQSSDDQNVYDHYNQPEAGSLLAYLIKTAELGQPGGGLKVGDPAGNWSYLRSRDEFAENTGVTGFHLDLYNFDFDVSALYKTEDHALVQKIKTIGSATMKVIGAWSAISWATKGKYLTVTAKLWPLKYATSGSFSFFTNMKLTERVLGAAGTIVVIGLTWVMFGINTDWSNPMAVKQAVALASAATVFAVVLFLIAANPVAAILLAVFAFVDLILFFAADFSVTEWLINNLAASVYSANNETVLESADFIKPQSGPVDKSLGIVEGNRFRVSDLFKGSIAVTKDGEHYDLYKSFVYGLFHGSAGNATVENKNGPGCYHANRTIYNNKLTCENDVAVEYSIDTAVRNIALTVMATIHAQTVYEDCALWGLVCAGGNTRSTNLPDDLNASDRWGPSPIYLDVLPDTVAGLWN